MDTPDGAAKETIIRLWGVDTPEVHNVPAPAFYGPEASAFTHAVADGRAVRLELVPGKTRGYYGRLLAYVYLPDGSMLNERLIQQGYAYADPRFAHPRKKSFIAMEKRARKQRAGLWARITTEKMPAWRQRRLRSAASPALARAIEVPWLQPSRRVH